MLKRFLLISALAILIGAGCVSEPVSNDRVGSDSSSSVTGLASGAPVDIPAPTVKILKEEKPVNSYAFPGILEESKIKDRQIRIVTSKGDIVFELFEDEAPKTVSNFVYLTREGFYDGLTFHRVEPGFVIQGGDPNGNGTGGPGYLFEDEPVKRAYDRGIVAMANRGPNTNGSQFFIMLADTPLPPNYTIFGRVTSRMEVVDAIRVGDAMTSVQVEARGAQL